MSPCSATIRLMKASFFRYPLMMSASGGSNTTISPAWNPRKNLVTFSTSSWSPTSNVGNIESEGMNLGSIINVLKASAAAKAKVNVLMSAASSVPRNDLTRPPRVLSDSFSSASFRFFSSISASTCRNRLSISSFCSEAAGFCSTPSGFCSLSARHRSAVLLAHALPVLRGAELLRTPPSHLPAPTPAQNAGTPTMTRTLSSSSSSLLYPQLLPTPD
mmetsp:Transcript_13012/g.40061  ORF Transcript_13012/g.40061 Transcript_13012/m.40061 type:complete len:217 (-) Transcript_13012:163-813(-)